MDIKELTNNITNVTDGLLSLIYTKISDLQNVQENNNKELKNIRSELKKLSEKRGRD